MQIHSHNYRVPEPFQNKIVVLIRSSASAVDISREIASITNEVHIASWSNSNEESETLPGYDNVWLSPMFELQCEWIAGILSGRISLPSQNEMWKDVEAFYDSLQASGVPKRYTHNITGYQFEYNDWLATQCGAPKTEEQRKKKLSHDFFEQNSSP
ncbi:putative FAD/NAD(P)-binding domain superfamily [Helianthus debilis subsp. tardiflorus]